ncbi:MAG: tetratricopeptide repeat protein [Elusimicrobia bacterium]|nr:tetratricopeptide repeat protein [Elusimicrobiota bacterium]
MSPPRASRRGALPALAAALGIALLVAAVYLPSPRNGFVNWDDRAMIHENPGIHDLSWGSLVWMFTTDYMSAYQPLGWLAYASIRRLQGLDPKGFHLASLATHAAGAGVLFLVGLRLFGPGRCSWLGAAIAALLFGLHPLQVEAVAWATGLADLLGTLFFLLAFLLYLEASDHEGRGRLSWVGFSLASFAVSGLCRWKGVCLPVVLAAVSLWPLQRFGKAGRRTWAELGAFAALAAAVVGANVYAKVRGAGYGLDLRLAEAGSAAMLYAWKTIWPFDLIPLSELCAGGGASAWLPLGLATLVTAGLLAKRRAWPEALAVWLCYLAAVAPPFALKGPGPVFAQDLHAYLACSAFYLAAGAALSRGLSSIGSTGRTALLAMAAVVLAGLAVRTSRQLKVWKDSISLWTHTLAVDEASHPGRTNLAAALLKKDRYGEAVLHLREQLRRHPDDGVARFNLEQIVKQLGPVKPDLVHYHNNLGADLFQLGRPEDAAYHFTKALALDPRSADTHQNLAGALLELGRLDQAGRHYERCLALTRPSP